MPDRWIIWQAGKIGLPVQLYCISLITFLVIFLSFIRFNCHTDHEMAYSHSVISVCSSCPQQQQRVNDKKSNNHTEDNW